MADTYTLSGLYSLSGYFRSVISGDNTGAAERAFSRSVVFAASGGTEPTIAGYFCGTGSITGAVDMLLAHATDPMSTAGSGAYVPTTYAPSGVGKIKLLRIHNTTASGGGSLTVARGAAAGAPIFDAASDAVTLPPGGEMVLYFETGTAVLTTTTNDKVTVTPSSGTVTFSIECAYGA